MKFTCFTLGIAATLGCCAGTTVAAAPNVAAQIERPLRYTPSQGDFVIENGAEFFNRPLYCNNSAFRIDAGDLPEFSLYLPGRGGNLRMGIQTGATAKWLQAADSVVARYRPGEMIYVIRDSLLGAGALQLSVIPMAATQGVIVRAELKGGSEAVGLILAYGGVNGQRGKRDGDIGCEDQPVSQFFQLKPDTCTGNQFTLAGDGFTLRSKAAVIAGISEKRTSWKIADARAWSEPGALLASASKGMPTKNPVAVGQSELRPGIPLYFALQRLVTASPAPVDLATYREVSHAPSEEARPEPVPAGEDAYAASELPSLYLRAEAHREGVAGKVSADTPDPYIDAATGALCVAADAVWDEKQGVFMHGAVAWRTKLLGWRGPYSADELGWHDRAVRHLTYWAGRQNTTPVPDSLPPADESANLSRNEASLHSNGDISNSHYDMNLVYIDALFRHILWTGDLGFARKMWPVIVRHLAWERRLFRRPFGPDGLPLYEGYCCIWASDDVAYDGGGAAHSTAYNYYHNRMAARLARLLGEDPAPYEREADLIAKAMRTLLWLPDKGWFGESKDLLGRQSVHSDPALWTFYHTIDSEAATPFEAWQMSRFVDTQLSHIPVRGPGVPDGGYYTLPTSNWMPYQWSTNNVVMAEAAHTALALWEAGRDDDAYRLFKGCLLDSMYLGLCPGNAGMCTGYDMARGESQRDFADASGTCSRTLVEGLFGVHPDALAGEVRVRPGFPVSWDHASIRHPDFELSFESKDGVERVAFTSKWARPMALRLQIRAHRDRIQSVTVDGKPAAWSLDRTQVGLPLVEIHCAAAHSSEVDIKWGGEALPEAMPEEAVDSGQILSKHFAGATLEEVADPQHALGSVVKDADGFEGTAVGTEGARTVFARLKKGDFTWWEPVPFEIRPAPAVARPPPASTNLRWETVDLTPWFNDRVSDIFHHAYLAPRSPYCSLALPSQGFGSWCHPQSTYDVDDTGLRAQSDRHSGSILLPSGVPLRTPGAQGGKNIVFTSQWTNFKSEVTLPLKGAAAHAYLLMAGSTNAMQSRFENGEVVISYSDGSTQRLALTNPDTWWPIDQDYLTDDYAFARSGPVPPRIDLKTGTVRTPRSEDLLGHPGTIHGGAATVLDLPLDPTKTLQSLTVRTLANEVVIGLMSLTLGR